MDLISFGDLKKVWISLFGMGSSILNWVCFTTRSQDCISILGELNKVWKSLSKMGTNMLNWVHHTPKGIA